MNLNDKHNSFGMLDRLDRGGAAQKEDTNPVMRNVFIAVAAGLVAFWGCLGVMVWGVFL